MPITARFLWLIYELSAKPLARNIGIELIIGGHHHATSSPAQPPCNRSVGQQFLLPERADRYSRASREDTLPVTMSPRATATPPNRPASLWGYVNASPAPIAHLTGFYGSCEHHLILTDCCGFIGRILGHLSCVPCGVGALRCQSTRPEQPLLPHSIDRKVHRGAGCAGGEERYPYPNHGTGWFRSSAVHEHQAPGVCGHEVPRVRTHDNIPSERDGDSFLELARAGDSG